MKKHQVIPISTITVFGFLNIFAFQNCSKTQFSINESSLKNFSTVDIVIEGGRSATNKKVLNVEVTETDLAYTRMKIYEKSQDKAAAPWIDVAKNVTVDLKNEYAPDGTKDNVKTIVAEFQMTTSTENRIVEKEILLDTVVPEISGKGILSQGLSGGGETYELNKLIKIDWEAKDILAPTKISSGLDPHQAIQIGWSYLADCSISNLKDLSAPMKNENTYASFRWPTDKAMDTFYICVFAKDIAGNKAVLLSQPLSYQWKVLMGDNNLGSGGSINSKSVRFNMPTYIEADNFGNLFVADSQYGQIRKISTDGIITTIAGNRSPGTTPEVNAGYYGRFLNFDSNNKLYLLAGAGVERLTFNESKNIWEREAFLSMPNLQGLFIKKDPLGDTIYLTHTQRVPDLVEDINFVSKAQNYILKIPLADIEKNFSNKIVNYKISDLIAKYHFAGSGRVYTASQQSNTAFEQPALSDDMGYLYAIYVDKNDDVYVSTHGDGGNKPYGQGGVRLIKKNDQGILTDYYIVKDVHWIMDMDIVEYKNQKRLMYVGYSSLKSLNITEVLNSDFFLKKTSIANSANADIPGLPSITGGFGVVSQGVAVVINKNGVQLTEPEIYATHTNGSKIVKINMDLNLDIAYGRLPFEKSENVPVLAAVNNPTGVIEDKNGNTYAIEAMSCIIRKINPAGVLSVLAGNPCSVAAKDEVAEIANIDLSATTSYMVGYNSPLVYDAKSNKLFTGLIGGGKISQIDLTSKANSIIDLYKGVDAKDRFMWPIYGMSITPGINTNDPTLLVTRYRSILWKGISAGAEVIDKIDTANLGSSAAIIGNIDKAANYTSTITDNMNPLSIDLVAANATATDENGDIYFISQNNKGTQLVRNRNGVIKVLSSTIGDTYPDMKIKREGSILHIYGVAAWSSRLKHIAVDLATDVVVDNSFLCMKGSYLSAAKGLSFSKDGNLLVADTANNRILKYYLYDQNQNLVLNKCK